MQEPSIAIALDRPGDKVYRPGDALMGRVELRGIDRPRVRDLRVSFRGISRVTVPSALPWSVPSDATVRSDTSIDLFRHQLVLGEGDRAALRDHGDGTISWPILFTFPSGTGSAVPSESPPSRSRLGGGGSLPPSLRCFSQPFDCAVEYALEADLEADLTPAKPTSRAKPFTARRVLQFEPATATLDPQMMSVARSFTLAPLPHTLDVRADAPPSFRAKFNSFIYRNRQLPTPFCIVARVPSQLLRKEQLPLLVTLQLGGDTAAARRRFEVRRLTVVIERKTSVQGPGNKTLQHTDKTVVIGSRDLEIALPLNTEVDLGPRVSGIQTLDELPPNFAGNGITRDYDLDFLLCVACGDDEFEVKGRVPSLVILPSAAPGLPSLPAEAADDEPPSYEAAVGSGSVVGAAPPYSAVESQAGHQSAAISIHTKPEFETRGRIFEFVSDKRMWNERGMAEIALQRDSGGKAKLLARHVKTGKVCADHYIASDAKLKPIIQSDRSWTWVAGFNSSSDSSQPLCLAARFKDSASANEFREAFAGIQKLAT
ncbi:ranBP1 domain-containing protein [Purpureocillium lavendulum]|uniref:RanBP1 domain-containing protein n=1 Tax=Purpureocillium lavendulum TaxID=1247861 RepID=A0AB34G901_9HYPO|nr:ranBP1 domain-containing protein [Purpureocillium lavendulum]